MSNCTEDTNITDSCIRALHNDDDDDCISTEDTTNTDCCTRAWDNDDNDDCISSEYPKILTHVSGHGSGPADDPSHPLGRLPGVRPHTALAGDQIVRI